MPWVWISRPIAWAALDMEELIHIGVCVLFENSLGCICPASQWEADCCSISWDEFEVPPCYMLFISMIELHRLLGSFFVVLLFLF
jgi:hypothetical protein